jgi:hypothetical protein
VVWNDLIWFKILFLSFKYKNPNWNQSETVKFAHLNIWEKLSTWCSRIFLSQVAIKVGDARDLPPLQKTLNTSEMLLHIIRHIDWVWKVMDRQQAQGKEKRVNWAACKGQFNSTTWMWAKKYVNKYQVLLNRVER